MQTKVCLVRAMIFPVVIHVWIWKLDYKENWVLKNWCFWTEVLEKTLDSPLDCKEIQPVHPKGNQSWIFIGRTDAEVDAPILWPPDVKNWLIGKDPDAGKDWRQEEKGITEDEMLGWHRWLDGHEFEQALGVGDAQGSLVHHSPWDHKESDTTKWLNWTAVYIEIHISFWTSIFVFFFRYTPRNGIAESYDSSIFSFWATFILNTVAASIYIPTNSEQAFTFLHILAGICYAWSFWQVSGDISLCFLFAILVYLMIN